MKVPGEDLNHPGDHCYIPVFNHGMEGAEESKTVIVGNILLEKYYLIYDMSPLETEGNDYIQIAFGLKNPRNVIRD